MVEVKKSKPRSNREAAWVAIRRMHHRKVEFTFDDIHRCVRRGSRRGMSTNEGSIRRYFAALVKGGVLVRVPERPDSYRMVRDPGILAPVQRASGLYDPNVTRIKHVRTRTCGSVRRARIWKSIRMFGQRREPFTLADLEVLVEDDRARSTTDYYRYLPALVASGYLSVRRVDGVNHYRLMRDTGPLHPILRNGGGVLDQNDGTDTRVEVTP